MSTGTTFNKQIHIPPFIDRNVERDCGVVEQPAESLIKRVAISKDHVLMALIRARQAVPAVAATTTKCHILLGGTCVTLSGILTKIESAFWKKLTPDTTGWDRTLLHISSLMTEPFLIAFNALRYRLVSPLKPGTFENCNNRAKELAVRLGIVASAVSGVACTILFPIPVLSGVLAWGLASKFFRIAGLMFQQNGYSYVRGQGVEIDPTDKVKVLTWNVCGAGGGIPIDHGGVVNWKHRFDAICAKIDEEKADVICLQEIYDEALWHALVERYQGSYAHFFGNFHASISQNPLGAILGSPSGGMVFTKCKFDHFSVESFTNNDWSLNSSFATLDLANGLRLIGTHLIYNSEQKRVEQLGQILQRTSENLKPTVLVGDLNVPRSGAGADTNALNESFDYRHQDDPQFTQKLTDFDPKTDTIETCNNELIGQWNQKYRHDGEYIDYIAGLINPLLSKIRFSDSHLVQAFDKTYNTQTALSDHHAIAASIELKPL